MRPTPIPDRRLWDGAARLTLGAPRGHENQVAPVEALSELSTPLGHAFHLLVKLDPDDLERLRHDPHFWLTIYGQQLPPFSLTIPEPD
jgi:hypothetical protein